MSALGVATSLYQIAARPLAAHFPSSSGESWTLRRAFTSTVAILGCTRNLHRWFCVAPRRFAAWCLWPLVHCFQRAPWFRPSTAQEPHGRRIGSLVRWWLTDLFKPKPSPSSLTRLCWPVSRPRVAGLRCASLARHAWLGHQDWPTTGGSAPSRSFSAWVLLYWRHFVSRRELCVSTALDQSSESFAQTPSRLLIFPSLQIVLLARGHFSRHTAGQIAS